MHTSSSSIGTVPAGQVGEGAGDPPDPVQAAGAQPPLAQSGSRARPGPRRQRRQLVEAVGRHGRRWPPRPGPRPAPAPIATRAATAAVASHRSEPVAVGPAAAGRRRAGRPAPAGRSGRAAGPTPGWRSGAGPRLAAPAAAGAAALPARTRIHGRDQQEPGREGHAGPGPADPDRALLERLAQGVEDRRTETRPAHPGTARRWWRRRSRRGASRPCRRRPARPPRRCGAGPGTAGAGSSPPAGRARPAAEWIRVVSSAWAGASGGSRPGSRRASMVLPAPGGPVSSRWWPPAAATSRAKRPSGWPRTSARSGGGQVARRRRPGRRAAAPATRLSPRSAATSVRRSGTPAHQVAAEQVGLAGAAGRHDDGRGRGWRRPARRCPAPGGRAVEAELAEEPDTVDRAGPQLAGRHQQGDGDRQVETGAALADARRRQVDRHPLERPVEPARQDGGPDPVPGLPAGGIGQADDGEAGQPVGDVDLDGDRAALDAEQRGGPNGGEHGVLLRTGCDQRRAGGCTVGGAGHSSAWSQIVPGGCDRSAGPGPGGYRPSKWGSRFSTNACHGLGHVRRCRS